MNAFIKTAVISTLLVGSMAASAKVTKHADYEVTRYNSKGTSQKLMADPGYFFCALTGFMVRDTDGATEGANCSITSQRGAYILNAFLNETNNADVTCRATCWSRD